jgi:hypothetical protein
MRANEWIFRLLAVGFVLAAFFHASAFFNPTVEPRMAAWGHALFVVINVAAAVGWLLRPRWFVFLFAILCVQQLISHGSWALAAWRVGYFDWRSAIVLPAMPLALFLLIREQRAKASAT